MTSFQIPWLLNDCSRAGLPGKLGVKEKQKRKTCKEKGGGVSEKACQKLLWTCRFKILEDTSLL